MEAGKIYKIRRIRDKRVEPYSVQKRPEIIFGMFLDRRHSLLYGLVLKFLVDGEYKEYPLELYWFTPAEEEEES